MEKLSKEILFIHRSYQQLGATSKDRFGTIFVEEKEKNIFNGIVIIPKQQAAPDKTNLDMIDWARIQLEQKELKRRLVGIVFTHRGCPIYLHQYMETTLKQMNKGRKDKLFLLIINNKKEFRIYLEERNGKIL